MFALFIFFTVGKSNGESQPNGDHIKKWYIFSIFLEYLSV